jgi:hypothetical protein
MSLTVWLTVRQAREALRTGRPEVARKLLDPFVSHGHKRAVAVVPEVARGYRLRGEQALRRDDPTAAWDDLLAAESLAPADPDAAALRSTLTKLGLAECRAALLAGNPLHALHTLARLKQRTAFHPEFEGYETAAREWVLAIELADRGDFPAAAAALDRGKSRVRPDVAAAFDTFAAALTRRYDRCRAAVDRLYQAAERHGWTDVLRAADEVAEVAPDHREVRNMKARAWAALHSGSGNGVPAPSSHVGEVVELAWSPTRTVDPAPFAPTMSYPLARPVSAVAHPAPQPARPVSSSGVPAGLPKRFVLWIDGVGGYLVCLGQRVGFGQATASGPVDVPLFADVSRLHAELTRDGEGYVLESGREVAVNGRAATRAVLADGDRVTLGSTCQFVFRLPVAISPSARLELVSGHRLPLAVDGILLMAENLILGPEAAAHVPMPDAAGNVVLYRTRDGLGIRCPGAFQIDGRPHKDRGGLPIPCCVTADSFSFTAEPVGPRV